MAKGYSRETIGVLDGTALPARKADGRIYGARHRSYRATLDLAQATTAKAVADTNVLLKRPAASAFAGGSVTVGVSLGSSTLSIGTAANPTKYMAAQTFTTPNVPVAFRNVAALIEEPLSDAEEIIVTIGAAALPNAGVIVIDYSTLAR